MDHEPDVWTHPELRAAVAAENWAVVLKKWRILTRTSQSKLGALVGLAQPDVSAIENRRRDVTSVEVRQRIIDGLRIPVELLACGRADLPCHRWCFPESSPTPRWSAC